MIHNEEGVSPTVVTILILLIMLFLILLTGYMVIPLIILILSPTFIVFEIHSLTKNKRVNKNISIIMIVLGILLISIMLILTYLDKFDLKFEEVMILIIPYWIFPFVALGIGKYVKKPKSP